MKKLTLASNSPRRKELLSLFGLPFSVVPADTDESHLLGEPPVDYVRRLAVEKAMTGTGLVIAADTIVTDGDELLGKPADEADARRMLRQLRHRQHQVFTGIAVIDFETNRSFDDVCCTHVPMRDYSDAEIDAYIATGDPMDKAGAYAIQHPGFHPVEGLSGCYASVMGLPACHLWVGLKGFIPELPDDLHVRCQSYLGYDCPVYEKILFNA